MYIILAFCQVASLEVCTIVSLVPRPICGMGREGEKRPGIDCLRMRGIFYSIILAYAEIFAFSVIIL